MASIESSIVALNNYLQSQGRSAALHWEDKFEGPRHEVTWTSRCKIDDVVVSSGTGSTKTLAREAAASAALAILVAQDGGADAATNSESAT